MSVRAAAGKSADLSANRAYRFGASAVQSAWLPLAEIRRNPCVYAVFPPGVKPGILQFVVPAHAPLISVIQYGSGEPFWFAAVSRKSARGVWLNRLLLKDGAAITSSVRWGQLALWRSGAYGAGITRSIPSAGRQMTRRTTDTKFAAMSIATSAMIFRDYVSWINQVKKPLAATKSAKQREVSVTEFVSYTCPRHHANFAKDGGAGAYGLCRRPAK
jgi:hypothetical protein